MWTIFWIKCASGLNEHFFFKWWNDCATLVVFLVIIDEQTYRYPSNESSQFSDSCKPMFITSKYGTKQLLYNNHTFNRHVSRQNVTYWRCSQFPVLKCRARIRTFEDDLDQIVTLHKVDHNHPVIVQRKYGSLKKIKQQLLMNQIRIVDANNLWIIKTDMTSTHFGVDKK